MSTDDCIMRVFHRVDSVMYDVPKHPEARLSPSEIVTLGLHFALKGKRVDVLGAVRNGKMRRVLLYQAQYDAPSRLREAVPCVLTHRAGVLAARAEGALAAHSAS